MKLILTSSSSCPSLWDTTNIHTDTVMFLWRVTIWMVLLFVPFGHGEIVVIPRHFTVQFNNQGHPSNNLTIMCSPPTQTTIQSVTFIQLRKYKAREDSRIPVATLTPFRTDRFQLAPEKGLVDRKYNLSGIISSEEPLTSFLRVEFYDSSCTDEGMFECSIHFYHEGASQNEILYSSANVSTKTFPDQLLLLARPSQDNYIINQTMELHCSGQVGSPPAYFRWQYRHTKQEAQKDLDYSALTFGVTHSEGPYPQGFCKHFRSATLWLRVEQVLDGVEIRCLPVRGLERYDNQSTSFVFSVKESACLAQCQNGGVCQVNTCQCPVNFTGNFCEQVVDVPCGDKCDDTSAGSILDFHIYQSVATTVIVAVISLTWR